MLSKVQLSGSPSFVTSNRFVRYRINRGQLVCRNRSHCTDFGSDPDPNPDTIVQELESGSVFVSAQYDYSISSGTSMISREGGANPGIGVPTYYFANFYRKLHGSERY